MLLFQVNKFYFCLFQLHFVYFTIDDAYTFEIGGPAKTPEQIRGIPNAYIVADGIKGGAGKKNTALAFWILILIKNKD
jgi:hypothetical protein